MVRIISHIDFCLLLFLNMFYSVNNKEKSTNDKLFVFNFFSCFLYIVQQFMY